MRSRPIRNAYVPACLGFLYFLASLGAVVVAAPVELPAISESSTVVHLPGKVVWADLVTPNLAGAETFYAGLFGWTFRDLHLGETDYAVASVNGRAIAGLAEVKIPTGEQKQSHWLSFIAVGDADATVRHALLDGATVLRKPVSYAGRGRQAVVAGPDGAVFGVIAATHGDPGDFLAKPGEWIWSSLLTPDPDGAVKFYQSTFGYDVFDLPRDDGLQHVVLSSQDFARAGINSLPKDAKHRRAHWLNFVRVTDTTEAAAKAVALGGRVLVEPRLDRHGGKVALLADPYGAPFGVMEWAPGESQEEPK
jgi:predicted enzyme related to lactoylglutathione lyase